MASGDSRMMTDRAAAGFDSAPADVATDPNLTTSDQPESDHPRPATTTTRDRRTASAETQRLYAADWRAFEDWCRQRRLVPLAADATTVATFLTEGAAWFKSVDSWVTRTHGNHRSVKAGFGRQVVV
jgi:hypothetical protein